MARTLVAGLLVGACTVTSGSAFQTQSATLKESQGVALMRMAMTVQANRPFGPSRYGSLDDVLNTLTVPDAKIAEPDSAEISGYLLRVSATADRTHYQIALTPSNGCGTAWFGDEHNIIYAGKALGCH